MARPLRIEFSGGLYHVTARGNARGDIYANDIDRTIFLKLLAIACDRHDWYCHAYCLMSNHYHLLIDTATPSLSKGMKYINGSYTQCYNRAHKRVGHLFQGRYKAISVERESYLLELSRYIVLNPVRARMVRSAKDWRWSSYRATAGMTEKPTCLTTDWILGCFAMQKSKAQESYRQFVREGKNQPSPWETLKNQIYLGSDDFVEQMQCQLDPKQSLADIPRNQKKAPSKPLSYYAQKHENRKEAMAVAYRSGHFTLVEVGGYFEVSYATVSRAVKEFENKISGL
jgi:REP element-mobilizing transposase RayT